MAWRILCLENIGFGQKNKPVYHNNESVIHTNANLGLRKKMKPFYQPVQSKKNGTEEAKL